MGLTPRAQPPRTPRPQTGKKYNYLQLKAMFRLADLDNSGSMRKNDPQFLAKGAVTDFINTLDESYRAGVIIFDESVKQTIPLMPVDDSTKSALIKSLDNIDYRGQLTDSPAAVERALYELKTHPREGAEQLGEHF